MVAMLVMVPVSETGGAVAIFDVNDEDVPSELVLATSPGKAVAELSVSLREALDKVLPTMSEVSKQLTHLSADEVTMEFGLRVGGEAGLIFAKVGVDANFTVRLVWRQEGKADAG
jgi:hypothetical protein